MCVCQEMVMGLISRLRIGARLALGFGLMLLLITVLIASSYLSLQSVGHENRQLLDVEQVKVAAVSVVDTATRANGLATTELLLVDPQQLPEVQARIRDNRARIDEALKTLDRLVTRPEGREALAQLRTAREAYVASFSQVLPLVQAGQVEQARSLVREDTLPALARLQAPIDRLRELQEHLAQEHGNAVMDGIASARLLQVALGIAALIIGGAASVLLARSIVLPLRSGVAVADRVAAGDLTQPVVAHGHDEVADLLRALAAMQDNLRRLVTQVHEGVEQVGSASTQIATANTDLSGRTEAQASALEQSAASMEELNSAIALNTEAAQQARTLAVNASGAAESSGETVASVVRVMRSIDDASQRIGDIIGVIDGIAFQTNILALNAAVEAARAGEQGRGFAVVASEVRSLASRSADAARQIKLLVADSKEQVNTGTALADRAGQAMNDVVHEIKRVSQLVVDIADTMREQSAGMSQVGVAIAHLDQATQQNAALVEETAAASQSLDEQARHLVASVARFRIDATAQPMQQG
jgi:methyl-accepting chemotaxis protein